MKTFIYLFFFSLLTLTAKSNIIDLFPYTCLCDKSNSFKFFDCKNKIGGAILELDTNQKIIFNSADEKYYEIYELGDSLSAFYNTNNYESSITIDPNLSMTFKILYPEYEKEWSYKLKCISVKQ
jgi:hypothetical protein